ncbi:MAG TPA: PQQ-binding-like beta-propeller repeat protein [Thermoleophilaceae bacterium]|nr:PQQ-binding-like beta-propeller repeat protein [Thermoleophilaceae bacterium]
MAAGFEFETRLRLALREAAEREAERGRSRRAVARSRSTLVVTRRSFVPVAAAVLGTLLALAVATVFLTRSGSREAVRPPEVVARFALGESLGGTVGAYGSVWVADTGPDRLLRVDPDSRKVAARLPVEGDVAMAPAGGTLWALNEGAPAPATDFRDLLLRIDPRSDEVTARLRLRTPSGAALGGVGLAADQDSVWILGTTVSWHDNDALGLMRLDPRTDRANVAFALPGGWGRVGIALRSDGLWAITADDRLLRYDPHTGEKLSETRLNLPGSGRDADPAPGHLQFAGDTLITSTPGGLAGIDPYAGRVVWRRHLGGAVNAWTEAGGVVWATVSPQGPDRLVAVEPHDGQVATSVGLDVFGAAGIASVGDELWVTTAGGEAVVLQR